MKTKTCYPGTNIEKTVDNKLRIYSGSVADAGELLVEMDLPTEWTSTESNLRWKVDDLKFKLDNARRAAEIWRQIAIAGRNVAIYRYCEKTKVKH